MEPKPRPACSDARGAVALYLGVLLGAALLLGVLHCCCAEFEAGGVYWFHLDRERNIPTWFSGSVFFVMGCFALVAHACERELNSQAPGLFRLPALWLGVGAVCLAMSLDEITILHENLFWREIRQTTAQWGAAWRYVTQWQVLFAPGMLLVLGCFAIFFANRFAGSRGARRCAFAGIACWLGALLLEGVRGTFIRAGARWRLFEVLAEEELELVGGILLLAAFASYLVDIAFDLTPERRERLRRAVRFLTPRAILLLLAVSLAFIAAGGVVYVLASRQAAQGAPAPRLYRKALESLPQIDE